MPKILLVDDDPSSLSSTEKVLIHLGHKVWTAQDGKDALEKYHQYSSELDLILTDVRMPHMDGMQFFTTLRSKGEKIPVIMMTAYGRVEDAVQAMKLGAVDFLSKPFRKQTLSDAVDLALLQRGVDPELHKVSSPSFTFVIGKSEKTQAMLRMVHQVSKTDATILIQGESGSGKELVARLIHESSLRKEKPFLAINCAALPESLMESELFGVEKGAYTGADRSRPGLFESAHMGTLLLDEIGEMPFSVQAKLLRVLQEKEVRRLGSPSSKRIDVRVISSTHRDLKKLVSQGKFREDLWYRLEVVKVEVPSLRERKEDFSEFLSFFVSHFSKKHQKTIRKVSSEWMEMMKQHDWPGNIRELSNVVERSILLSEGETLEPKHLIPHMSMLESPCLRNEKLQIPLGTPLKEIEDLVIQKTLEANDGDKAKTAKILGIHSRTIYRKLHSKE